MGFVCVCVFFFFFYSFNVRFCLKADGKGALPRKLGKCSVEKLYTMVLHMQHLKNILGYLNIQIVVIFFNLNVYVKDI